MLEIIRGDLFNEVMDKKCILAHGCNCQGAFGSGVAGLVAKLYPFAKTAYMHEKHRLHLGQVIVAKSELHSVQIANCMTQENYGRDGKQYVSYDAVVNSMLTVARYAKAENLPVYMPLIGGGLGGGDEKRLTAIMQAAYYDVPATLVLLD